MSEFDPTKRSIIHDKLKDRDVEWQPEWAENFLEYGVREPHGVIGWYVLMLDGWKPTS